jgi:hypothetical protein
MRSWFLAGSHPQDYEQGLDNRISYSWSSSASLPGKEAVLRRNRETWILRKADNAGCHL